MQIGKIYITDDELKLAVQQWLASQGIEVTVTCVQKSYLDKQDWEVTALTKAELIEMQVGKPVTTEPKATEETECPF